MKKLLVLLLIGGVLVAFSSCARAKFCDCTDSINGTVLNHVLIKGSALGYSAKAYNNCKEYQKDLNVNCDGDCNYTCKNGGSETY
jgi:hypothetical protein